MRFFEIPNRFRVMDKNIVKNLLFWENRAQIKSTQIPNRSFNISLVFQAPFDS